MSFSKRLKASGTTYTLKSTPAYGEGQAPGHLTTVAIVTLLFLIHGLIL